MIFGNKVIKTAIFPFCFLPTLILGQIATFTVEHEYQANRNYSLNAAQTAAMQEAQTDLLRQLGILVKAQQISRTITVDGNLQQDFFIEEAITYTLGRVQTVVVEERLQRWSEFIYSATFRMEVDTADLFRHLDNIVRQREQASADSIARAEQARASIEARNQKIFGLQSAVQIARNSLTQEEQRERPLRVERDRLQRELQSAQRDRENAQRAFDNARRADNAHTQIGQETIQSAGRTLQNAESNYNKINANLRSVRENLRSAERNVERARNNLRIAENDLARETGMPTTSRRELAAIREAEIVKKRKFVFSVRPEYTTNFTTVMGVGVIAEAGIIGKNGLYLTGELSGGAVYFGGLANVGVALNPNGAVKNVFGLSGGYRNLMYLFDFRIDGEKQDSIIADNIGFGGLFWKLMFGKTNNLDITNRILLGTSQNPTSYDLQNSRFIYERGVGFIYSASIGYTLTMPQKKGK